MRETSVQSPGQEDPLKKEAATHSSILPGELHGQRSLVGYSPWGHKESDTTEWLTLKVTVKGSKFQPGAISCKHELGMLENNIFHYFLPLELQFFELRSLQSYSAFYLPKVDSKFQSARVTLLLSSHPYLLTSAVVPVYA